MQLELLINSLRTVKILQIIMQLLTQYELSYVLIGSSHIYYQF